VSLDGTIWLTMIFKRWAMFAVVLAAAGLAGVVGSFGVARSAGAEQPLPASSPGVKAADPAGDSSPDAVAAFLSVHCVQCHGPAKSKAGVKLHAVPPHPSTDAEAEQWTRVAEALQTGEMPPEGERQPDPAQRAAVLQAIRGWLKEYEQKIARPGGAAVPAQAEGIATARRLTNVEYQNTMRDLLGMDLSLAEQLPNDPAKPYHFNNTAGLMLMGPEQFDHYLSLARRAMASAIVDPEKPRTFRTRMTWTPNPVPGRVANRELSVWPGGRGNVSQGMTIKEFPRTGAFRVRLSASAILTPDADEAPLRLLLGQPVNTLNSATLVATPIGTVRLRNPPEQPQTIEFIGRIENYATYEVKSKAGVVTETMTITPQNLYDDGTLNDDNGFTKTRHMVMPRVVIDRMEFEGPLTEVWPPAHHTRILFDSPLRDADPDGYVREVLRRFMSRAYRRPATDDEVARFAKIYATLRPGFKTFEAAVRETLSLVLVSPQFLYHASGGAGAMREYELASRLSYFLWGSMPDDRLLTLAGQGKLSDPAVLTGEVDRLLADPRSADFVRNFTTQWLSLEKMRTVPINRDLFPRFLYYVPLGERAGTEEPYRPTIRDYMVDETAAFVAELIRANAGVANVVHSDFACLNQALAAHYGVPGVRGDQLRVVKVGPEHHLGGLLTHGSVLIGNGTGTAPHPIYRAVWLREAILGDEVPPPPADVPALSDSAGASAEKALTIKDLLVKHRQQESCNDCHARLDPWGIPFEQYNAIGLFQPRVPKEGTRVAPFKSATHKDLAGYRAYLETVNQVPIEADTRLPGGQQVNGMDQLKAYLLRERLDDIAANVARRLLSYGLGRETTWRDRTTIDAILSRTKPGGYGFRDLIVQVCVSEAFRGSSAR
jgi:mono/diheme cytochrome c family protein